jgi:hypothetical protein
MKASKKIEGKQLTAGTKAKALKVGTNEKAGWSGRWHNDRNILGP